ncbi:MULTISPECIES: hypothetical protein [unclassified Carboxylicivirga]|uniref:hypothetical protein n=1 Tax=Carboxylicivirga TaxID=1628153 RepID=UPI003D333477
MNEASDDISGIVKQHIQAIDLKAEVILLFPQGKSHKEEIQIYVLTPQKVDFETEQKYLKACYQVELASKLNLSIYIYFKEKWHQQLSGTPIYRKVSSEGILL